MSAFTQSNRRDLLVLIGLILTLSVLIFSSCKHESDHDHEHDTTDTDKPIIKMTSPTEMQTYDSGDTVFIQGLLIDYSMHALELKILKDSDSSELYKEEISVHDLKTYTINTFWKNNVVSKTNAKLIVSVEDHANNIGVDTVGILLMP